MFHTLLLPQTRALVKGIQERAELLLNVTISHDNQPSSGGTNMVVVKEDLLFPTSPTNLGYTRSISAPPSTTELNIRYISKFKY